MEQRLREHLVGDDYGNYRVSSVYFDTDDYKMIFRSMEDSAYKQKLRLRYYDDPTEESPVYLELKKKYKGIVYKRRIPLRYADRDDFRAIAAGLSGQNPIAGEIDYFLRKNDVAPKVRITYDRVALADPSGSGLRVTFDSRLRWVAYGEVKSAVRAGVIAPGQTIMEIKSDRAIPLWLVRLLDEYHIFPGSFSKYGTCFRESILPEYKGGKTYAV